MACGVIDLDALSYVAAGPVEEPLQLQLRGGELEGHLAELCGPWRRSSCARPLRRRSARGRGVPRGHSLCNGDGLLRVTAPADTVQDRLRRRECGVARDFLMGLSRTLAPAEIEELAFEDFAVRRTRPIGHRCS